MLLLQFYNLLCVFLSVLSLHSLWIMQIFTDVTTLWLHSVIIRSFYFFSFARIVDFFFSLVLFALKPDSRMFCSAANEQVMILNGIGRRSIGYLMVKILWKSLYIKWDRIWLAWPNLNHGIIISGIVENCFEIIYKYQQLRIIRNFRWAIL